MSAIVQFNEYVVSAPAPNTLQSRGAIVSCGATTLTPGYYGPNALLTGSAGLASILASPLSLTSLAWSGGQVTATSSGAIPGLSVGDTFITTVANATPARYNGTFLVTVASSTTFTYPLAVNPGTETSAGTYTAPGAQELTTEVNSFFARGQNIGVYVLELGPADGTTGPPLLQTWIAANPGIFYVYLVPEEWDGTAAYQALLALYGAPAAQTYFVTTTTLATYGSYMPTKAALLEVEAPGVPLTEFDAAQTFQGMLSYAPSATNMMTQLGFLELSGLTPYPSQGNSALFTTLEAANVNWVASETEAGITYPVLRPGNTLDGHDFSFWYAADWVAIQAKLLLTNAVVVGSQDSTNPLSFNTDGIRRLQQVLYVLLGNGISFNLLEGTVARTTLDGPAFSAALSAGTYANTNVVNAIPFADYIEENPSDYPAGRYAGFTLAIIPQVGFKHIVFNMYVTIPGGTAGVV